MKRTGTHHSPSHIDHLHTYTLAHWGKVVTRDSLLNGVWGIAYTGSTRTLDTRIASLRRKLGTEAGKIETVHGSGYRYRQEWS